MAVPREVKIPDFNKSGIFTFYVVAGDRIARSSQGYEPRELLLLYPAFYIISYFSLKNKGSRKTHLNMSFSCLTD
jgi:hypothetical protein